MLPISSYIFWTEWGTQPRLSRCSMDGKPETRQTLIDREIIWPNALTIDYSSNTLWWADAKLKKIEQCDLNGSNRKVVLREDTGHPFSLAVSSRYIYWTNWDDNTLDRINKNSAFQYTKNTYSIKTRPLGIALVDGKKHEAGTTIYKVFVFEPSLVFMLSLEFLWFHVFRVTFFSY